MNLAYSQTRLVIGCISARIIIIATLAKKEGYKMTTTAAAISMPKNVVSRINVSRDLLLPRSFIITRAKDHVLETGEVKVQINDLIVTDESQQQEEQMLHGAQAVTSLKERQAEPEPEPTPELVGAVEVDNAQ